MKLGICLLLIADSEDPLGKEWIGPIARCNYDYGEVSLARIYGLSEEEVDAYRTLFEENHLPVLAFNNAVPAGFSIVGDEVTDKDQNAYIQRTVALAARFGVKTITTSGPNQKWLPKGFDWENRGQARYVAFLKRFSDRCFEEGITLALEPICSAEKGLINRTDQAMKIIEAVSRPNMKLIVDLFHFALEGEDPKILPDYARRGALCHLHVAQLPERTIPNRETETELQELLYSLKQNGFDGLVSVEARAKDPGRDIPLGARVLEQALRYTGGKA